MERYKERKIPIDMFEFWMFPLKSPSREVFPLIDKWIDTALQNGVKDLVYRYISSSNPLYPVPIFTILASKSLIKLVLARCDLRHLALPSGVVKCDSLRELSVSVVRLDENMLQTLLASCPLIENFIIELCTELKKIELLNLQKIKSVSIWIRRDQHVKIQAPTLEHLSYFGDLKESTVLDVVECQNLKSLKLSHARISGVLEHLISRSKFLESLTLDRVSKGLGRFNICEKLLLKDLKIKRCEGIGELDAPNLVSLEYVGSQIPELEIAKKSSQLKHTKIVLYNWNNLNVAWFRKFRNFLSNWTSCSKVSLCFSKCNEINSKELQLHHGIATPQVDVLEIDFKRSSRECPTFVDALLWSCHPRKLELISIGKMTTCFIDRLMYIKSSGGYTSHGSKPWHSQLKEVKAYTFDQKNKQRVELRSEDLAIRNRTERVKVYFLLDW
ncbi:uncharacterized protein LOC132061805 [Lycium ferocissimum]|uniref:uncharacterized protein LOC132061805 n=1 Tax=Lycium ferocissimum TaxID=112874 RepID=UPI0028155CDA|nr:uncharacterized protein LOC132061805 [Lycium ferocissimum]